MEKVYCKDCVILETPLIQKHSQNKELYFCKLLPTQVLKDIKTDYCYSGVKKDKKDKTRTLPDPDPKLSNYLSDKVKEN